MHKRKNRKNKVCYQIITGGVEYTRLEAKANDRNKIYSQGQEQVLRELTLSRPRTRMLEAKAKNQGPYEEVISKKQKKVFSLIKFANFLENSSVLQENKCLQKIFCKLSGVLQNKTKLVMTLAHFQQVKK